MGSISVAADECAALGHPQQVVKSFPGRPTNLGHLEILRALPIKDKRLVGPWNSFAEWVAVYSSREETTLLKPMAILPSLRLIGVRPAWRFSAFAGSFVFFPQ